MFAWDASFIKSIEVDNNAFECQPQCDKTYLLRLQRDTDNGSWSRKVEPIDNVLSGIQSQIDSLDQRVSALED